MIRIFGTLVLNDNTSRCLFHFFEIFIFWAVSGNNSGLLVGVKGLKIAQSGKKTITSNTCNISGTV